MGPVKRYEPISIFEEVFVVSQRRISLVLFVAAALFAALCGTACAAADEAASPHFGVLSLLPPVVAIVLCLTTHEVIPSLFVGRDRKSVV